MRFEALRKELYQYYLHDLTPRADAFCEACERELDALWQPEMTPAAMKLLQYISKKANFSGFSFYCFAVGVFAIVYDLVR